MTSQAAMQLAAPTALTATGQGAALDIRELTGICKLILNSSIPASGQTSTVSIQGSADGSTNWTETGIAFAQLSNASTSGFLTLDVNVDPLPRYLRVNNTIAGTGTITYSAAVVGKAGSNH